MSSIYSAHDKCSKKLRERSVLFISLSSIYFILGIISFFVYPLCSRHSEHTCPHLDNNPHGQVCIDNNVCAGISPVWNIYQPHPPPRRTRQAIDWLYFGSPVFSKTHLSILLCADFELIKERDNLHQILSSFDQLQTRYNNLTEQKVLLQTSFDQLLSRYNNLTEERDDLKRRICGQ